ncbi:MAG TPA: hypothetical protein VN579_07255 [Bryobacteraceae bacterium]|nr:hypothetical protein [Bryobacteraceae bacterium]
MTLPDAITAVETASSAYAAATTTTQNDKANVDAIQAKLDTANAQVTADQQAQDSAASELNSALDTLIVIATASKIPVS